LGQMSKTARSQIYIYGRKVGKLGTSCQLRNKISGDF
jgi:hypothetical protein